VIQRKLLSILIGVGTLIPSIAMTQSNNSEKLIKVLEVIYLKPERRSPHDKVVIQGDRASIQVWKELPPNPVADRVECSGYQWLLTGRGQKLGFGAKRAFKDFPSLNQIQIEFVENETRVESVDKKGKLKKVMVPKPYLKISIDRSRAARIPDDTQKVREQIRNDTASCVNWGRSIVASREINL